MLCLCLVLNQYVYFSHLVGIVLASLQNAFSDSAESVASVAIEYVREDYTPVAVLSQCHLAFELNHLVHVVDF
jgi:hypothetical protein